MAIWLTPLAVLAVLLLVRFVGCNQLLDLDQTELVEYPPAVLADRPVSWWRLQEKPATTTVPGGTAKDEMGNYDGAYYQAPAPLAIGDQLMTPAANPIVLEIGVTGLIATDGTLTSMRVQGAAVEVPFAPQLNPAQFTLEMFAEPEWNINNAATWGKYYCVLESSDAPAEGSGLRKSRGFAIYAGPDDPSTPNTPYRWQFWAGDGSTFRQLKPVAQNDGTLVTGAPTYIAVTFDGAQYALWVYTQSSDVDMVKHVLASVPYVPATVGPLRIGLSGLRRALVGPAPGPNRDLYPFSGRIQEVAIYDKALIEEHILSHLFGAFTT
jgi:hypothetical protein